MAKKKRGASRGKQKKHHEEPRPVKLPDRRAMEGVVRQFVAGLPGQLARDTPLDKAQTLMYQAFDEPNEKLQDQLAREALAVCPDCADAYVLLAEHAASAKEALHLYQEALVAGERALGKEAFQRDVGHFWSILETRPYMRARSGLAHVLWVTGRREQAVGHLQDMLRLNPNDNQGVRSVLAGFLLFLDRDDDLARLLQQYPTESSATWAYTEAILTFRQQGDTIKARQLLKKARKINKHVPVYLLGEKNAFAESSDRYSIGDENEAADYVRDFLAGWKATAGAMAWLRANMPGAKKPKDTPPATGPVPAIIKSLVKNLPSVPDVWQADFRQMPNWMMIDATPVRPWVVLAMSRSADLVLAHEMPEAMPSAAVLWDTLTQAMQHPAAGEPHRPTEVQVRPGEYWDSLRTPFEEIGVTLVTTDELDFFDAMFNDLSTHICGKPRPGLLDMPGLTAAQVGSFYAAAAAFFKQAPWKKAAVHSAIKIVCDKFQSGPWYAVLMGQSGLTTGLALYEDLATLRQMWSHDMSDEEGAQETVGYSITFGEEWEIPVADADASKKYGWPVARSDAYPEVIRKERGMSAQPPLGWELELIEGSLRAVPRFIERHPHDESAQEQMTIPVASGKLTLELSWAANG